MAPFSRKFSSPIAHPHFANHHQPHIFSAGLSTHAYYRGTAALLTGGPPAAVAALLTALVFVLPLFSADETAAAATPRGWSAYLRARFGTRAAPNLAKAATLLAWLGFAVR